MKFYKQPYGHRGKGYARVLGQGGLKSYREGKRRVKVRARENIKNRNQKLVVKIGKLC